MKYRVEELEVGSKKVDIVLKLVAKTEPRYAKGFKITTFTGADKTGQISIPFWNAEGDAVRVGDIIKIQNGYVTEYPSGSGNLQLNIGRFGRVEKVEAQKNFQTSEVKANATIALGAITPIEQLVNGGNIRNLTLQVLIQEKIGEKTARTKRDGKEHRIATYLIGDASGCIYLDLWDELIELVHPGMTVTLTGAYMHIFRKQRIINLSRYGKIEPTTTSITINSHNNLSAKEAVDG